MTMADQEWDREGWVEQALAAQDEQEERDSTIDYDQYTFPIEPDTIDVTDSMQTFANRNGYTYIVTADEIDSDIFSEADRHEWWVEIVQHIKDDDEWRFSLANNPDPEADPLMVEIDEFIHESQFKIVVEPEYDIHRPIDESRGMVRVGVPFKTDFGFKRPVTFDTYDLFKESSFARVDGLWDELHHSWNDEARQWTIDSHKVDLFVKHATDAGFEVRVVE